MSSLQTRLQTDEGHSENRTLSVEILGQPRVLVNDRPVEGVRRKARALLYYLAAHSSPVPRERLLALMWPDLDRRAGQHTLRSTLCELHGLLDDMLMTDKYTVALAPEANVDARLFERRLSPPTTDPELLATTLKLYRADFLDGFSLPDVPEFDSWVDAQRERYRRLALGGLVALAELHEKSGNLRAALEDVSRALDFDPLQEDLQRICMRLHYLMGDRAAAIRRYDKLRRLLDEEMGVPPMSETRQLYDAIITDTLPGLADGGRASDRPPLGKRAVSGRRSRASETLPFVGREAELKSLRRLVSGKAGQLVLIEGEPGIGKTRLVDEFIRGSGALVVRGTAHELEQVLPYQPIVEALRGLLSCPEWPSLDAALASRLAPTWRAEIERLIPDMAGTSSTSPRGGPAVDERRLWEAVNQFLLTLGRQRPVFVFLDDLHWADTSTLGMLGYLIRQAVAGPIAFVAATRPVAPRTGVKALLQELTREGRLSCLTVGRLDADDITSIARQLSPTYAHVLAEWLWRVSEGNPYMLAELVRDARERGLLRSDGVVDLNAMSASLIVPHTVSSLIQARLERLSEAARRMLDAAAVVGREFEFDVAARAAALPENTALDGLEELQAAGLICPLNDSQYGFDHSLTVEVALHDISEARRQLLHRRVAEVLESMPGACPERIVGLIAWHFGEGKAPDRAAPYALRAARQARRLTAWTEAIGFYQQALAVSDGGERAAILDVLGRVYFHAGQLTQAAEVSREASALARSRGDTGLAEHLQGQALVQERVNLMEFSWGTTPLLQEADLTEAAHHCKAAEGLLGDAESVDPGVLVTNKLALAYIAAQQGDLPQAIAHFRAVLALAHRPEDQNASLLFASVFAHVSLAYYLALMDHPSALEHALSGVRLTEEHGLLRFQPYALSVLGEVALVQNDLESAERHLTEGLRLAERLSVPYLIVRQTANLGRVALGRGQTALAVDRLSAALDAAGILGARQLSVQIRLWLIPILPPADARLRLAEIRTMADPNGSRRLVEEIARLEAGVTPRIC